MCPNLLDCFANLSLDLFHTRVWEIESKPAICPTDEERYQVGVVIDIGFVVEKTLMRNNEAGQSPSLVSIAILYSSRAEGSSPFLTPFMRICED